MFAEATGRCAPGPPRHDRGSEEAFPAETESAQKRFPLVRNSVGRAGNLRNNAVYDRRWDWVLIGAGRRGRRAFGRRVEHTERAFAWESRGPSIELVFRPRFYQKHRGRELRALDLSGSGRPGHRLLHLVGLQVRLHPETLESWWTCSPKRSCPTSATSISSWTTPIRSATAVVPKNGLPGTQEVPRRRASTRSRKIKSAGMKAGIWVHRVYRSYVDRYVPDIGKQHPDWFVTKADGTIYQGGYGVWTLNTRNKEALDAMVRPLFRELRQQGWDYVKIDGAGDMLYSDREKPAAEHFKRIGSTPEQSLRDWDSVAREELGRDIFILSCWGVRPGRCSVGLADGCRLGSDGFQWNTLLGNSSADGVVWRGDPDHCDIMAAGAKDKTTMKTFGAAAAMSDTIDRPCVVSMAGGMLLVSDKAEDYQDDGNLEGMKRSAPVLFTVPGQTLRRRR